MEKLIAVWGFVVAGVLFLVVGVMPLVRDGSMNTPFFVLGIAFLVLGAAIARRPSSDEQQSGEG